MRPSLLFLAVTLALPGLSRADTATPADAAPSSDTRELDNVVVTATRTERALADVPNTVDVITRERMDDQVVRDLRDLFRYEPGISVGNSYGRFGLQDIRIRGLGGNRVRIQTDGIPVSDAFSIGSFSNANRNFVDLDTLKRVEVLRGPGSSLYGSDALGGVVSFITRDPSDYLQGSDAYVGFKLGYDSENSGLFGNATTAFGGDRWSGLVAVGHRQGKESENMGTRGGTGSARTLMNPQSTNGRSLLTKLVFEPTAGHRFKLTVEGNEDTTDTDVLTSVGFQALTNVTNTRVEADDHQTRARVSFGHEVDAIDAGFADSLDWQVYRQDSETTQYTLEERSGVPVYTRDRRERWFNFDQRTYGLQANLRKTIETGSVTHDIAYGLDVSRAETKQKRDGLRTFLLTGGTTSNMSPDNFPVRDFPNSRTTTAALYLQDEMSFAGGAFRLVPAVRVDYYKLDPTVDTIFAGDNSGVAVSGLTETSVSPKLGAVWKFAPDWSLFAGYQHGFRAPPYNDVNIGFTNVQFGYTAIANPDLRPETSDGVEAGLRFSNDAVFASVGGYYNRYDDFIASLGFVGFNQAGLMVYQSRNVAEAEIHGVELKAGVDLGAMSAALDGWRINGAAAWSRGKDRTSGEPLSSVDPLTSTLGVGYGAGTWGAELVGRFVARQDRLPSTGTTAQYYVSPGYGVLDLFAHWEFAPGMKITTGIGNLTDRKYFPSGGVPLVNGTSTVLDRYTAAGRTFALSWSVDFR